jgi:hypothetical protein
MTTDAEIDRAIEHAKSMQSEPRVTEVEYRPEQGLDLLILKFKDGHRHVIPREDLQGLQSATKEQIARVEILSFGDSGYTPIPSGGVTVSRSEPKIQALKIKLILHHTRQRFPLSLLTRRI